MHRRTVSAIGGGVPPGDLATNSTAIRLRISCHRDAESRCCARPRSRLPPSWRPRCSTNATSGSFDPLQLRRRAALVLQTPVLFEGSVADNLRTQPASAHVDL